MLQRTQQSAITSQTAEQPQRIGTLLWQRPTGRDVVNVGRGVGLRMPANRRQIDMLAATRRAARADGEKWIKLLHLAL